MSAQHTPGPWHYGINRSGHSFLVKDPEGRLVCNMSWHHSSREHYPLQAESEANARLIAAAPELLEALTAAWNSMDTSIPGSPGSPIEKARAALAKATGAAS